MAVSANLKAWLIENDFAQNSWTDDSLFEKAATEAVNLGALSVLKFNELQGKSAKPADVFGGARVKRPSERYNATKSVAKHSKTGLPVRDERGRVVETISEAENFKAGCLFKKFAQLSGQQVELNEHEREGLEEIFAHDEFCGELNGEHLTGVDGARVKMLLDDSTSGGSNLVPEWFDDNLTSFPLLNGEFLPRVTLIPVPRGSSVEGGSLGNPTAVWGTPEGTEMSFFDTASLAAALNCDLHPVNCVVEIGKDFLADSAANVGAQLQANVGMRMMAELDRVIVTGNGTTEPTGIFNSSGLTDIGNPAGGAGATAQVDDFETLMFSVPKQYRNAVYRPAFFSNDVSYSRARGIAVGASDARRVFGMDEGSYQMFDWPYLISNDLANTVCAFGCLARYKMYRREGQSIRFVDSGKELALRNTMLLVARSRWGGRAVDGAAFAFSDNWKA